MKKSFLISLLIAMQLVALGFGNFNVDLDSGAGNSVSITNPITANNGENIATVGENMLEIVSPQDGVSVDYSYITLKIKTVGLYRVSAKNESLTGDYAKVFGYEIGGVKNDDYYFIYNVPLQEGENDINITIKLKDNLPTVGNSAILSNSVKNRMQESKVIKITSTAKDFKSVAVGVGISPLKAFDEVEATITTASELTNIKRYYYDFDSDGKIDKKTTKDTLKKNFGEGSYTPMLTVETEDGLFFSSYSRYARPLLVTKMPEASRVESIGDIEIIDMQYFRDLFILTKDKIYIFNHKNESVKQVINLGDVSNPQGFYITKVNDGEYSDIYVADTGNNRVIRFLEKSGYQRDINYEVKGDFNQPVDVIAYGGGEYPETLKVLDRGNNRVVIFKDRNLTSIFTGDGILNGKLNNPINFFGDYLLDRDGAMLREVDTDDRDEDELGIHSISHGKLGKIVNPSVIASKEDKELLLMFKAERLNAKIKLDCSPTIAIPMQFGERDKTYFACKEKRGLFSILPYEKPKDAQVTSIGKKFMNAVIAQDKQTMLELVMFKEKVLKSTGSLRILGIVLKQTVEFKCGNNGDFGGCIAKTNYRLKNGNNKGKKTKIIFTLRKARGQFINTGGWVVTDITVMAIRD